MGCAAEWSQCHGQGFTGPTCCSVGLQCVVVSEYYGQCRGEKHEDADGFVVYASPKSGGLLSGDLAQCAHDVAACARDAAARWRAAATEDPKLWGLPAFGAAVLLFLLLACVTFCRVRRRGGRRAPPKLDFEEQGRQLVSAGSEEDV